MSFMDDEDGSFISHSSIHKSMHESGFHDDVHDHKKIHESKHFGDDIKSSFNHDH